MISSVPDTDVLRFDTFISLVRVTSMEETGSWKKGKVVLEGLA